jgi:hypothetical protein
MYYLLAQALSSLLISLTFPLQLLEIQDFDASARMNNKIQKDDFYS